MRTWDALYYIMTGQLFDGRKAAEMGLVNEAVPKEKLRERVRELADVLLEKRPAVLKGA
jgi:trans-feruloyl-CoA hydratase/vanillin synthase